VTWDKKLRELGLDPEQFSSDFHVPVLLHDVLTELITDKEGSYVDCTLGGGGHTLGLLKILDNSARVIAIDQDQAAIDFAKRRLEDEDESRIVFAKGNFGDLHNLLKGEAPASISGILMDLGVSSHQIDEESRGFTYRGRGPLDMRMNTDSALSADNIINTWPINDLSYVLGAYGEEKRSRIIARAIVEARPVKSTDELAKMHYCIWHP